MPSTQHLAHPIGALASALRLTSRPRPSHPAPAKLPVVAAKWPTSFALTANVEGTPTPTADERT